MNVKDLSRQITVERIGLGRAIKAHGRDPEPREYIVRRTLERPTLPFERLIELACRLNDHARRADKRWR